MGRAGGERLRLAERLADKRIELANACEVFRTKLPNFRAQIRTAVPLTLTISIEPLLPSTS